MKIGQANSKKRNKYAVFRTFCGGLSHKFLVIDKKIQYLPRKSDKDMIEEALTEFRLQIIG